MTLGFLFRCFPAGLAGAALVMASACGGAPADQPAASDGIVPMVTEAPRARQEPAAQVTAQAVAPEAAEKASTYWGVKPGEPVPIIWDDLMPEGGMEALDEEFEAYFQMLEERYGGDVMGALSQIEEGSAEDFMPQLGSFETVPELDGLFIRMPGYTVPFDFDPSRRHRSFLLVPYMGACIHSPPPPPNQIVYVEADPGVVLGELSTAYWVEGTLRAHTQESELAAAAYTLTLTRIEEFNRP